MPSPSPINVQSTAEPLTTDTVTVIEPRPKWTRFRLSEVWAFRELLYFLTWRDLKVRYKQTVLGVIWVVMQPALMTLIFTVFLGVLARVPTGGVPYPLLGYSGLVMWLFFSTTVGGSSGALVGSAHLITKVYFPRVLIPMSYVGARLIDFGISLLLFGVLMLYYHISGRYHFALTLNMLMIVPILLTLIMLALGLSMILASLNVVYRDIGMVLPVFIQLWMFVSPVVYPVGPLVPLRWRFYYSLNPLVGIIDGFRSSLFGLPFDQTAIAISVVETLICLVAGVYVFSSTEKTFADVV